MNPPELFIHPGSDLIEMSECRVLHSLLDLINCITKTIGTSFHHAAYGSRGDRNVKNAGKDLVGTLYTDSTYCI